MTSSTNSGTQPLANCCFATIESGLMEKRKSGPGGAGQPSGKHCPNQDWIKVGRTDSQVECQEDTSV
jgi:hypothetical protein